MARTEKSQYVSLFDDDGERLEYGFHNLKGMCVCDGCRLVRASWLVRYGKK